MKIIIIIIMMFISLGGMAQQKREYLNIVDSVVTIDGNTQMHYQKCIKKVYWQNAVTTFDQATAKIAGLVQDSMNCEDAIAPLKSQHLAIKNNAGLDSLSKVSRLTMLKQRYDKIQDELNDIELRKIQEQKLFDAF